MATLEKIERDLLVYQNSVTTYIVASKIVAFHPDTEYFKIVVDLPSHSETLNFSNLVEHDAALLVLKELFI